MESTPLHKAVFFDRDGTINSDEGHYYIYKPEDFVFNPGVVEGMKRLAGCRLPALCHHQPRRRGERHLHLR